MAIEIATAETAQQDAVDDLAKCRDRVTSAEAAVDEATHSHADIRHRRDKLNADGQAVMSDTADLLLFASLKQARRDKDVEEARKLTARFNHPVNGMHWELAD
ncbi:MAG: hypothetical protein ACTSU0_06895 [Alphaproteobacteria bacterium]